MAQHHERQQHPGEQESGEVIDSEAQLVAVLTDLPLAGRASRADARIVDEDVEPTATFAHEAGEPTDLGSQLLGGIGKWQEPDHSIIQETAQAVMKIGQRQIAMLLFQGREQFRQRTTPGGMARLATLQVRHGVRRPRHHCRHAVRHARPIRHSLEGFGHTAIKRLQMLRPALGLLAQAIGKPLQLSLHFAKPRRQR